LQAVTPQFVVFAGSRSRILLASPGRGRQ